VGSNPTTTKIIILKKENKMNDLIIKAIIAKANAQEAEAKANLANYMSNSVGVGEHPGVVEECEKLVKQIAEARELRETAESL
jgi:hypothetical protein